jgi:DNA polymerase-3 subunit epsilon
VLVLGGSHDDAAAVRSRVAELGGQPAVNLSASVTDIVALPGAEQDPRWTRAVALPLGWLDDVDLQPVPRRVLASAVDGPPPNPSPSPAAAPPPGRGTVAVARGAVTDLVPAPGWTLSVQWDTAEETTLEVDVVAFVVDADEQVADDLDFCFYNNPAHPTGAVEILTDAPGEALVRLQPDLLPEDRTRVVIAAALDGNGTFAELGAIELVLRTEEGAAVARSTLDAASTETTLVLATLYDRGGMWRLRAVGQGYEAGLSSLAVRHGVDVDD